MNCKHCGAALEENVTVCPACGEVVTAHNEIGSSNKGGKIIAIALAALVLVGAVAGAFFAFGQGENAANETTESTAAATTVPTEATVPQKVLSEADLAAIANADVVVATLGDRELTNGMLQMYYGRAIWDMVEEYGSYLSYFNLDLSKPLDEQAFPYGEDTTWHQYFLEMALDAWTQQQTLVCMAEEANHQYPEGLQTYLDSLKDTLDSQAALYGYTSGDALVQAEMGANTNVELYKAYSDIYNKAAEYYAALFESFEATPEQVEAYFDEHAEELQEQYGVTKVEKPVVDVRHILLVPEASVDEETGATIYTDESKAACLQKAEALLEQWKNGGATEEYFAQLASEHSKDPGSNTNGGLYDLVYQGEMVDSFDAWCFDESRKSGDTGIVETEFGYHVMYFVYGADEWYRATERVMVAEMCNEMIASASRRYGFQVYYWKIVLGKIDFS